MKSIYGNEPPNINQISHCWGLALRSQIRYIFWCVDSLRVKFYGVFYVTNFTINYFKISVALTQAWSKETELNWMFLNSNFILLLTSCGTFFLLLFGLTILFWSRRRNNMCNVIPTLKSDLFMSKNMLSLVFTFSPSNQPTYDSFIIHIWHRQNWEIERINFWIKQILKRCWKTKF